MMRKFLLLLAFAISFSVPFSALAFDVPARPTGFVQDYAAMLSADQVQTLEAKLEVYEKTSTNEIAVVTIPSLDGDTIENVAQNIFTEWGIGKKDKNNGVLLLISLADRKTRIQTGYGVEGDLTDLGTHYIQDEVITPAFKAGDYYGGINGAVDKMIEALGENNIVPENQQRNLGDFGSYINWIIFLIIVGFQLLSAILGRSKSWWGGGIVGGVIAILVWHFFISSIFAAIPLLLGFVGFGLLFDFLVSRAYTQKKTSGSFPWWFGGGSGGGGGGFGGFGGGGSGGGGSSGGW